MSLDVTVFMAPERTPFGALDTNMIATVNLTAEAHECTKPDTIAQEATNLEAQHPDSIASQEDEVARRQAQVIAQYHANAESKRRTDAELAKLTMREFLKLVHITPADKENSGKVKECSQEQDPQALAPKGKTDKSWWGLGPTKKKRVGKLVISQPYDFRVVASGAGPMWAEQPNSDEELPGLQIKTRDLLLRNDSLEASELGNNSFSGSLSGFGSASSIGSLKESDKDSIDHGDEYEIDGIPLLPITSAESVPVSSRLVTTSTRVVSSAYRGLPSSGLTRTAHMFQGTPPSPSKTSEPLVPFEETHQTCVQVHASPAPQCMAEQHLAQGSGDTEVGNGVNRSTLSTNPNTSSAEMSSGDNNNEL